ncbi:response regulator transcription factor [Sphingomonas sp. BK069]|uniref:response regulator transcription factor n=1 Tax=Sphingomonas sp. BK069 TaxID=2586979 RepID=UPI00160CC828|nr:response regulator [Sphingomonas sp. BK069]
MPTMPSTALIAVVDDDEDVRISVGALLGSVGLDVALFGSADDLLASSTLSEAACVVSDVQMPGTDGIQLARQLRAEAGPPVILMTAFATASLRQDAELAGVRRFLQKPFAPDDLLGEIEGLLN